MEDKKTIIKAGLMVVLMILLGVVLFLAGRKQVKEEQDKWYAYNSEEAGQVKGVKGEMDSLEMQEEDWQERLAEISKGVPCVMLGFDTMDKSLIQTIVPIMEEYGMRGTYFWRSGTPLNEDPNLLSTEELQELTVKGWQMMMAKDGDVEDPAAWMEGLDITAGALGELGIPSPNTYFYQSNQESAEIRSPLYDRGYRVFAKATDSIQGSVFMENDLLFVNSVLFSQGSAEKLKSEIKQAIGAKQSVAITIHRIDDGADGSSDAVSTKEFRDLLEYLKMEADKERVKLVNYQECYQHEMEKMIAYDGAMEEYNTFSGQKEMRMQELQEEIK